MDEMCKNCRYWMGRRNDYKGGCRRHAPVYLILSTEVPHQPEGIWPFTWNEAWCGDYEASPKKDEAA